MASLIVELDLDCVQRPLYMQQNNTPSQRMKRCKQKSQSRNRTRRLRR